MTGAHLSDDRLIEACLAPPVGGDAHLDRCPACRARRDALRDLMAEIACAAEVEADAVFTPERLARQQARILQRIVSDGPGRVIAFPAGAAREPYEHRRARPATRWMAAAAAAAFVVGLVAGHLVHELPGAGRPASPVRARVAPPPPNAAPALRTAAATDDEFLGQVELAVGRSSPVPLGPLDALTPRPWEVR